jgi:hypothetical protein
MSNGYFNNQTRAPLGSSGKGPSPGTPSGSAPAFKEKPGFSTGSPGKTQKDRSAGVPRAKTHPGSDGL